MIKTYLVVITLYLALLCVSNIVYSQTDSSSIKIKNNYITTPEERSTIIFRILNDEGIKFKGTRAKVFKLIDLGEKTEATNICNTFIKEIADIRSSTEKIKNLCKDDLRYLDKSLKRMQEDIEELLSDIPFMQLIPN